MLVMLFGSFNGVDILFLLQVIKGKPLRLPVQQKPPVAIFRYLYSKFLRWKYVLLKHDLYMYQAAAQL